MVTVIQVFRELSKIVMFSILWATPPLLSFHFESPYYLVTYVVSMIGTFAVFSHFEKLVCNGITDQTD